jgi:phosphoglycerol transferase
MNMKIAIQNSLPNLPECAEAEWIQRCRIACQKLGHTTREVVTSDDINQFRPDCVLLTHEFSAKLTEFPTLGLLWSPPSNYSEDTLRIRAILSLDGYLCGSTKIAQWVDDLCCRNRKKSLIHDRVILPSSHDRGESICLPSNLAIFYAGTGWDGSRHGRLFKALSQINVPLKFYGNPSAWKGYESHYFGQLKFDGNSAIDAIKEAGISLCLHAAAHREYSCPSMRLFEAAAAGSLIITDNTEFARCIFRDSVLYVDLDLPTSLIVKQVYEHYKWAIGNRDAAERLAKKSNEIFRSCLSLEKMLSTLPQFVEKVKTECSMLVLSSSYLSDSSPVVEYYMRIGLRDISFVGRALDSLAMQNYENIAVLLIQFNHVEGLGELLLRFQERFKWINIVIVPDDCNRSTSWCSAIKTLVGDYVGCLGDGDTLHSNHVSSIMQVFKNGASNGLVYSGLIRLQEEDGCYFDTPNFRGPNEKTIMERREIYALGEKCPSSISPLEKNYIGRNAWICKRMLFVENLLINLRLEYALEYAEDVFLPTLLAGKCKYESTGMPTAVWHWRRESRDI